MVTKYWDAINDRVTDTLIEIGDFPPAGALDDIDPLLDMYGCGHWGCAYPTSEPRWTVKVSADPTELDIVAAVLSKPELRENPGIVYILGIWRLPEPAVQKAGWADPGGQERIIHVTLRENIKPIETDLATEHEDDLILLLHHLRVEAGNLNSGAKALELVERRGEATDRLQSLLDQAAYNNYETAEQLWLRHLQQLQNEYETAHLAWFISDFARDFNTALADIHAGNVGLREHSLSDLGLLQHEDYDTWVAFDLGHSLITNEAEVPLISNPSRIQVI